MWGRFYLHVILLIFTIIFYVSCQERGSLTFVIDISISMGDDLNQVQKSALWEIDHKYSLIKNLILVTFNDAGANVVVDTADRDVFKNHLNNVRLQGVRTWDGFLRNYDDCPEKSMNAVIEGLRSSLPGSYIYVFTDASAKDYERSVEIKRLCQKKQSQVFFILTGKCTYYGFDKAYHVYYDIAAACTGLAIGVDKSEVQKVFDSLKGTNTETTTVLKSVTVPRYITTYVPFEIDDETEYAIVTASGDNVELKVLQEGTSFAKQIKDLWFFGIKVIKLYNLVPGEYKAVVHGSSEVSVYIVARTDFIFSHGFSKLEPKNINDTTKQPINGAKTHLSVLIHDPKHTVNITSVQILDMNEKVIKTFHLKRVNGDFFTTEPFIAPSERFKVAVIGNAKSDGKEVKRIAKIPVTPQDPPKVLPDPKSPVITISEGSQIAVDYGKTVKLTCKVSAYPEPKITWRNSSGTELKSQSAVVELPYEYISYLTISNFIGSDTYTCHAENAIHSRKGKNIQVIAKDPFVIKSTIQGATELKYGEKGILTCDIRGSVPIRILWRFENDQGKSTYINTSDKYTVSADGTKLIINKMNLDLVGEYSCSAYVLNNPDRKVNYKKRVEIGGLEVPKISGEPEKTVKVGDEVKIKCKIFGVPKPTITWQFMAKGDSKFVSISSSDNVMQISNVGVKHAGRYKCVAHNIVGETIHDTILTVQVPPIITTKTSVFNIVEGRDRVLQIPCKATGDPKPDISWEMRGAAIEPSSRYAIEDGALIIKNPTVADGLTYKCLAKNKAGSIHKTFDVKVFQVPKISGEPEKTVKVGDEVKIKCKIFGVPKPTITWQFMAKGDSKFVSISSSDNVLRISNVAVKHAGHYKCVAHNIVEETAHVTVLTVQVPPIITTKTGVYNVVEGRDRVLQIPCKATGDPKPDISWEMRGAAIEPSSRYAIEDGALIIKNPTVADGLTYKCLAKNKAGSIHKTFDVKVFQVPKISGEPEKTVKVGDEVKIKCKIFGVPKPTITWQFMAKGDSKFVSISSSDNVLRISNVAVKHAGHYKCVAHNIVEETAHVTVLTVQVPPIITTKTGVYNVVEGRDRVLQIPCKATGDPKPDISWEMRGAAIEPSSKYAIEGEALIIKNPTVADGLTYKCLAKNKAGSIHKTFDVKVFQVPKISGEPKKTVKVGDEVKIKCKIFGVPKPTITWQFMAKGDSKFVSISSSDNVLRISNVAVKHAGHYKCVAHNIVEETAHVTVLTVQVPPIITTKTNVFNIIEDQDRVLRIPCKATGDPKPDISWEMRGAAIEPNSKYAIEDGALIIKNPTVADGLTYKCLAKNKAGSIHKTFDVKVFQKPKVSGEPVITVKTGDAVEIKCNVIKGVPEPKINWEFMAEKSGVFLQKSGRVLSIPNVNRTFDGRYRCIAQNRAGSDEHTTTLNVEFAPIIKRSSETFKALNGDVALKIPCHVIGLPQPEITWKLNGTVLSPDSGYSIVDGALIIKDPKNEYENGETLHFNYICEAKNYLGSDKATFSAEIHSSLDDYGTSGIVNLLDKTSPKLECVPAKSKQSVRWFLQGKELNVTTKYIQLHNLDILKEGNYSCRVSDMNGGHTYTYEVLVDYPPTFDQEEDPIFDWTGTKHDKLDCEVNARPRADIVWSYNGNVLKGQESSQLVLSGNWGLYACNVSNVHGTVYRTFEVTSSRCLIPRIPKDTKTAGKMPLMLTKEWKWPILDSVEDYLTANHDEIILLSCPHPGAKKNSFQKLPTFNEISAICDKEDIFIVNGKPYHVSELQCTDEVDAVVIKKEGNCLTESSELIRVGYEVNGFLETYRVCFDTSKNMPLFSRVIISKSNIGQGLTYSWHKHPSIHYSRDDGRYTCNSSNLTCCYEKTQLVNVQEVMDGSPQRSTFIDPLNAVPYWHPCDGKDPLDAIEKSIKMSIVSYYQLIVWSGTHDLQETNGQVIPRYLWKVIKFDIFEEAIAIVYINVESPSKSDVLCKNICDKQNDVNNYLNWLELPYKNVYCCRLNQFLKTFGLHGTGIGEL